GAFERISLHRPVARMHVQRPAESAGFDRAIARFHLQIALLWHAHFNVQPPIVAPAKIHAPVPRRARDKFNLVAILPRAPAQVLTHSIALILTAKLNLLRTSGRTAHAPVFGFPPHFGPSRTP